MPKSRLLQLAHSYDLGEMYGDNYGYRSGFNPSMVRHLTQKVRELERTVDLQPGDTVLDIGSNDATSLKAYKCPGLRRVGIDPTGAKFRQYYPGRHCTHARLLLGRGIFSQRVAAAPVSSRPLRCSMISRIRSVLRKRSSGFWPGWHLAFRAELHALHAAHERLTTPSVMSTSSITHWEW